MDSVLEILSYIFWVIVAIMILVFVHEMGHFLFAKLFGMRVDRFSVGFPPKIVGKTIGGTEYVIGATPLGGYVKIAGMVDESLDAEELASAPQPWEFRAKPVWQRIVVITAGVVFNVILAFLIFVTLKTAYGELYVPAENIKGVYVEPESLGHRIGLRTGDQILAVSGKPLERYSDLLSVEALMADRMTITVARGRDTLTFEGPEDIVTQLNRAGGMGLGISPIPALIGEVQSGSPAAAAGLQSGDRIVSISGKPIRFWMEMTHVIQESKGKPVAIEWLRPDSAISPAGAITQAETPLPVSHPDSATVGALEGAPADDAREAIGPDGRSRLISTTIQPRFDEGLKRYAIGVSHGAESMLAREFGQRHKRYGLGEAVASGARDTWVNLAAIATSLKRIVSGRENLRENVGGPIMIARVTKQAAASGARDFWNIVAILSLTLAIMNILPIPALDGGHLVLLLYEGITRREPSLRVRMALQQIGMVILLALMAFLIFNDILRL